MMVDLRCIIAFDSNFVELGQNISNMEMGTGDRVQAAVNECLKVLTVVENFDLESQVPRRVLASPHNLQ